LLQFAENCDNGVIGVDVRVVTRPVRHRSPVQMEQAGGEETEDMGLDGIGALQAC